MRELLQQPYGKYIIGGVVLLYIIIKYVPLKSLLNIGKKSKFKYDVVPEITELVKNYNNKDFSTVESSLNGFSDSYKDFGINALSTVTDDALIDEWLQQSPGNELALIVKGAKLIVGAWNVRGNNTIDQVEPKDLAKFKSMLEESRKTLVQAREKSAKYGVSSNSMLLKLYKGLDINRSEIHNTFKLASEISSNNIEMNINYYACISAKWGGTKEEMEDYYKVISDNQILRDTLTGMSYNDQLYFVVPSYSRIDKKAWKEKVKTFIKKVNSTPLDESNLHKYELYRVLAMLADDVGGLDSLVKELENKSSVYYKW